MQIAPSPARAVMYCLVLTLGTGCGARSTLDMLRPDGGSRDGTAGAREGSTGSDVSTDAKADNALPADTKVSLDVALKLDTVIDTLPSDPVRFDGPDAIRDVLVVDTRLVDAVGKPDTRPADALDARPSADAVPVDVLRPTDTARPDLALPACIPGQSVACACTDGRSGAQVCAADGTFGPCTCTG